MRGHRWGPGAAAAAHPADAWGSLCTAVESRWGLGGRERWGSGEGRGAEPGCGEAGAEELGRGWDESKRCWGGGVWALLGVREDQGSVLTVDVGRQC